VDFWIITTALQRSAVSIFQSRITVSTPVEPSTKWIFSASRLQSQAHTVTLTAKAGNLFTHASLTNTCSAYFTIRITFFTTLRPWFRGCVDTSVSPKSASHAHHTHTNGYILRSHALIQHTLVFAPLVVSIPTVICRQYNSLEPSQYVLQIYWHTLVLFRIRALIQHYYATYTQYDVLLYLTWMQYICSVLWNTLV